MTYFNRILSIFAVFLVCRALSAQASEPNMLYGFENSAKWKLGDSAWTITSDESFNGTNSLKYTVPQNGLILSCDDTESHTDPLTMNYPANYNLVWTKQSEHSGESMPVGGHSIGLNVWVENGDILFYAQRSGSFTENNEYHKLGRFRVILSPNPFEEGTSFKQELKLDKGYCEIIGSKAGNDVLVRIWVEALRPIVHVDIESTVDVDAIVRYESWRTDEILLHQEGIGGQNFGCFSWMDYPNAIYRYADSIKAVGNDILFYHRNRDDKLLIDYMLNQQALNTKKDTIPNTQKGRTFGGLLRADGFVFKGTGKEYFSDTTIYKDYLDKRFTAWTLESSVAKKQHSIKIFTHVDQTNSITEWLNDLNNLSAEVLPTDSEALRSTEDWWEQFWGRSWLILNSEIDSRTWRVGRNYQLFRYQLGCNFYGEYPTKFNGGNFTTDPKYAHWKNKYYPDYRSWGGGSFTAQNQRLVYWPLLKTGDFDGMLPQFEFYKRMLPAAKARVQEYWGHNGCLYSEQVENFGLPIACAWGWSEPNATNRQRPENTELGVLANKWIIYHYESQLEFSYMILEYHRFSGADISSYMDFIKQSIIFFDEHYQMRNPLDANGKLVISPSTACETYKDATNPADVIAGLEACLDALLSLDETLVSAGERIYFKGVQNRIPDYTYGTINNKRILKPAKSWGAIENHEMPQFYPLFPFNRFTLDSTEINTFINTWKNDPHVLEKKNDTRSWHQDGIMMARMGLTDEARDFNTRKMDDSGKRTPTFWGPGHDWVPDHNHGGVGMIALQEMLMQTIGDKIIMLPAWPKDWGCDFKLHAPSETTVEGKVREGKLVEICVTPASRAKDIIIK